MEGCERLMRSWGHTCDHCCLICHSCTHRPLSQDGLAEVKMATFCRAGSVFFSSKGGVSCVLGFSRALILRKKEHHGLAVVFSQSSASGPFFKKLEPGFLSYMALLLKKSTKGDCKGMSGCSRGQEWLCLYTLVLVGTLCRCTILIFLMSCLK